MRKSVGKPVATRGCERELRLSEINLHSRGRIFMIGYCEYRSGIELRQVPSAVLIADSMHVVINTFYNRIINHRDYCAARADCFGVASESHRDRYLSDTSPSG